jgi:hypothetical protein
MLKNLLSYNKIFLFFVGVILLLFFAAPLEGFAQTGFTPQDFTISSSPANPKPNQSVTYKLNGFGIDMKFLSITWQENGIEALSGIGERKYTTTAGASGVKKTITAFVRVPGGQTITKRILLQPANLDIVWEVSDSYVPPLYPGKALPPSQASIIFYAIPDENLGDNLVYTWEKNFEVYPDASGFKKDSFEVIGSILEKEITVRVTVQDLTSGFTASSSKTVSMVEPFLAFRNTSSGKYLGRRGHNKLTSAQIMVIPFFFSVFSPGDLEYAWSTSLDGVLVGVNGASLLFEGSPKNARTEVTVESAHPYQLLQEAVGKFLVR